MKLSLLFCLIGIYVFSQAEKQTIFLQADYGYTSYSNSATTKGLCPTAEVLFTSNASKKDSLKVTFCFFTGFTFIRATQVYEVQPYNSVHFIKDIFYTNEFLFNMGGLAKINLSKNMYLNIGFGGQMGGDYSWSKDPFLSVSIARYYNNTSL